MQDRQNFRIQRTVFAKDVFQTKLSYFKEKRFRPQNEAVKVHQIIVTKQAEALNIETQIYLSPKLPRFVRIFRAKEIHHQQEVEFYAALEFNLDQILLTATWLP